MDRVTLDLHDGIAEVRINRPDKLNAFDMPMFEGLAAVIDGLGAMREVRCVVLSGAGRAFSVGIDLELLASGGVADLVPRHRGDANLFQYVACGWRSLPQPVIVAVHGFAFGAGFQIMLGGDIRVSAPDAQFSIMEARWGLVPDMGGFALLRGLVRPDVARELTYSARKIDGLEAQRLGLVTRVAEDPLTASMNLARRIVAHPPEAVAACKRLHNLAESEDVATVLMEESVEQAVLLSSDAHRTLLEGALSSTAKPRGN